MKFILIMNDSLRVAVGVPLGLLLKHSKN